MTKRKFFTVLAISLISLGLIPSAQGIVFNFYAKSARPSVINSEKEEGVADLAHFTYEPLPKGNITKIVYEFAQYRGVSEENQFNTICYKYNFGFNERCVDFNNTTAGVSHAFSGLPNNGSFTFKHKVENEKLPVGPMSSDYVEVYW
ncbi:hypothetical protein [Mobiluncus mulieris]|uniref:hypothetical protein n=1 Tax=Mobiluncus mulieris TaxID=2052 RepID=UPI00243027E7|nr:hypothetical protein [Mobiluncus mulieris]